MLEIQTTTDCVKKAEEIVEEAKTVSTKEEHAKVWDKKVEVLRIVNGCLNTGGFEGKAYEELWKAKHLLYRAEEIAGNRALETYANEEQ